MAVTYTPTTNFGAKDSLPQNDPDKVIKGSEFTTEFTAIQTAFSLAAPNASPTFTGTVTIPTADINGGNIDGTVIGAATPAAGSFTTGQFGTSLNVDGTVTADGLSLDASVNYPVLFENQAGSTADAAIGTFDDTNGTLVSIGSNFYISNAGAETRFNTGEEASGIVLNRTGTITARTSDGTNNTLARLNIANNGDISFYEDTGTTPKFFWDASAESLGIGNSSPQAKLDVTGAGGGAGVAFRTTDSSLNETFFVLDGGRSGVRYTPFSIGIPRTTAVATNAVFQVEEAGYLTVLNSGNVGIGTSSPSALMHVEAADGAAGGAIKYTASGVASGYMSADGAGLCLATDTAGITFRTGITGNDPTDTGSERMRIDSSGNVGIGCVPNSIQSGFDTLQIGGNLTLNVDSTGAGAGVYMGNNVYRDSADSRWEYIYTDEATQYVQAGGEHIWRYAASGTANTAISWSEAMRLDTSGNLLVGTTSQHGGSKLSISQDGGDLSSTTVTRANTTGIQIRDIATASNDGNGIWFNHGSLLAGIASARATTGNWGTDLRFYTHPTTTSNLDNTYERMRIDPSGNVLVGKTTSDLGATAGIELNGQYDVGYFTRSGDKPLVANRLSSDGTIVDFRKDGTVVGSIGSSYGDRINIGTGNTGVMFRTSSRSIDPADTTTGLITDGAISLGRSGSRFKNLYLSGGVYLGGTGAANFLDDYEEGTWTPSIGGTATYTVQEGTYVKIGKMVFLRATIVINTIGSGSQTAVTGIPFSAASGTNFGGSLYYIDSIATNVVHISPFIDANQSNVRFRTLTAAGATFGTANVFQDSARVDFTIVYETT